MTTILEPQEISLEVLRESGYLVTRDGRVLSSKSGNWKELKPRLTNSGYLQVNPCIKGKAVKLYVHRLVALTYVPNQYGKPNINHKDSNRTNNLADNLEWCTQSENIAYAFSHNGRKRTGGFVARKLTGHSLTTGESIEVKHSEMRSLGLTPSAVYACLSGRRKSHAGYSWSKS